MTAPTRTASAHGAALLLAMILLAALTVIGVAAISLSGQERRNATAYYRVDFVQECANAARAKLWADLTQYGVGHLGASVEVTSLRLPDGTVLEAPAHIGSRREDGTMPYVKDVVVVSRPAAGETLAEQDCTNRACGLAPPGSVYTITAHCIDPQGRELEVEAGVKFAL